MPEGVTAESSTHEAELARVDGPDGVGETVIVLDDQGDAPLSLEAARAFGLALLSLADEGGRAPRRAGGARRSRGQLVLSRAVHDAVLCGWRIATRDDDRPELAWCAGCGCAIEIGPESGA